MTDYYQGPGRNIHFCLITTGIDIDPDHGGMAKEYYMWLKNVIEQRAEIHFENRTFREVTDVDASGYLQAYSSDPRTVTQFLYGLVEHSNGWTEESLTEALDTALMPRRLNPEDGEYSIDFAQSREDGMTLYENQLISAVNTWVEHQSFYYSTVRPVMLDGEAGDTWMVPTDDGFELWIKPAFTWVPLLDYVKSLTPQGSFTISDIDPGNTTNSWWLDLTGLNIRKFSAQLNTWQPVPTITVSATEPGSPSDGDLWVKDVNGRFKIYEYSVLLGFFKPVKVSKYSVRDRDTNTVFKGTVGDNTFVIDCDETALTGGPISGGAGNLRIKKDGVLVQTAVDCIDFLGPDLDVVAGGAGEVSVEHLEYTTLPEQTSAPPAASDSGRIFTLEISGVTELFYRDDSGDIIQLTSNGVTAQNIFLAVSTTNAVPGQTVFPIPTTAKAVLTVKVNGVDTTAWTYTHPSVTYIPALGGYTIQSGDVVSILYYGQ